MCWFGELLVDDEKQKLRKTVCFLYSYMSTYGSSNSITLSYYRP